jgi:cysteine synthase
MKGAIARAEDLVKNTPNAWMPQQFNNPANPEIIERLLRRKSGTIRMGR